MSTAVYPGGRPYAWHILAAVWLLGAVAGGIGYWELLYNTLISQPTLHDRIGRYAVIGALLAVSFLRLPFYQGAFRMGRPLSALSAILFPICNAVLEGFVLLFLFDAGRWILGEEGWGIKLGSVGYPSLRHLEINDRRMFREFLLGFAPYVIGFISSYALIWEEHVLPVHMDLGVTNKFVKAMVMANMATILMYWLWADVGMYVLLRLVNDFILVLAVRLPPPGAELTPPVHPEDFKNMKQKAAKTDAAGKSRPTRQRQKKTN